MNLSSIKEVESLEKKYEKHFNVTFPKRIIGWWEPRYISDYSDEFENGVKCMRKDVEKAVSTNIPIK